MNKKLQITIFVLIITLSALTNAQTSTSFNSAVTQPTISDTLGKGLHRTSFITIVSNILVNSLSNFLPAFNKVYAAADPTVTFTLTGLSPTLNNTVININGKTYTPKDFPLKFAWTQGSVHRVTPTKSIPQGSGRRYNLTNPIWEGLVGRLYTTPSIDTVINLYYDQLCLLTVNTVGLIQTYPTIVSVNGVSIGTAADARSLKYWLKSTLNGTLSVSPDIISLISRNYKFTNWREDNSTAIQRIIRMNEPLNLTAVYKMQWLVNIVPDAEIKGVVEPTGALYFDPGSIINIQCSPKEGFFFTRWTTKGKIILGNATQSSTSAFINGTGTISANFANTTVQIRINVTGVSNYNGSIITVDDKVFTYPQFVENNLFNWVAGSTHKVKADAELPIDNSTRYQFATWVRAKLPNDQYTVPYGNDTFTALYRPQYYLKVDYGGYGVVRGEGWILNGTRATISIEPLAVGVGTGVQYVFIGWTSSGSKGYNGTNSTASFLLTEPVKETAVWEKQRIPLSIIGSEILWIINIGVVGVCIIAIAPWAISKLRK